VSPRPVRPEAHRGRVEQALYFRCRRGEPEALATLLYRMVDRLYTAASFVAPDETSATTDVVLAWEDTLALLTRSHVGGRIRARAVALLGRRLLDFGDRKAVARALRNALHEDEDSLVALPEESLRPLVEMIPRYAPQIAAGQTERRAMRRRVLQSAAAAGVLIVAYATWLKVGPAEGAPGAHLTCLQQRITKCELLESLRDCLVELPDPQGADEVHARTLQQVSLALEEIANAADRQTLRYLTQRLQQEALPEELEDIIGDYDGTARRDLRQAQLVLEEVQGL